MMLNNFYDDFNFKKKKTSNLPFILKIVIVIFAISILFYLFYLISYMKGDNSYEIEKNGERYGRSQFIEYQGKIYVPVPSGGMYVVDNADINTFKVLNSEDLYSRIVGLDKNNVYFGNIAIPDLNPNTFYYIGNEYYSDGTNTYYCSSLSERNKNLSTVAEIFQTAIYSFSDKKPQSYIYPYKKVATDKKLTAVENLPFFATDGEKVYYKGEVLENADLSTLKNVEGTGQNEYFADKENIYYKSKLLPIKNSGKLMVISSDQGDRFLYDEKNGYIFMEDYSFDMKKVPYKAIGNNGNHLYNLIFVANDGIYYYDNQKKKQLKAGDNIFIGDITEISPNVFMDDKNIYYFGSYEKWIIGKSSIHQLSSRNTMVYYLDKKDGWEKVKDIRSGIIGTIWKKGNKYYYFDNLGIFQLIDNAIYEITDKETLEYLLENADEIANSDSISKFIENKKLIGINGEEKLKVTIKYKSAELTVIKYSEIFLYSFVIICIILTIYRFIKKAKN